MSTNPFDQNESQNPAHKRESLAHEILFDEPLCKLLEVGLNTYLDLLTRQDPNDLDEVNDLTRRFGISGIRNLLRELHKSVELPRRIADASTTGRHGENITHVILGIRPQRGNTINQIKLRTTMNSTKAAGMAITSLSYGGKSPEQIIVDRGQTTTRYKLSMINQRVRWPSNANQPEIIDSTGIQLGLDDNGRVTEICGITFKGQVPHFTDDLTPEGTKSLQLPQDSLDKIHDLAFS